MFCSDTDDSDKPGRAGPGRPRVGQVEVGGGAGTSPEHPHRHALTSGLSTSARRQQMRARLHTSWCTFFRSVQSPGRIGPVCLASKAQRCAFVGYLVAISIMQSIFARLQTRTNVGFDFVFSDEMRLLKLCSDYRKHAHS